MPQYDTIIIGSGAGGSAAAYQLAQTGRSVLLIERGPVLPTDGSTLDVEQVIRRGAFKSEEAWLDKDGAIFKPEEYFNLGGKTKWYGAALLRYGAHEFDAEPAHQCLGWPIRYQDLQPFYDEAETLLGVRHFEIEPDLRTIIAGLEVHGDWQARPLPLGLSENILAHPREAAHFDGFASAGGLKADAERTLLARVSNRANFKILTDTAVARLIGPEGAPQRLAGVETADGSRFLANKILLAAGAMHSPRLLQRYLETSGLARVLPVYRLVGRYYKRHLLTALLAFSGSRKTDVLRKTALLLNQRFPHSSIQPLGFGADVIATLMPRFLPLWLARLNAGRAYGFFLQTEDGSVEANRVLADCAADGYPRLDFDQARLPSAVAEHQQLISAFRRSLFHAGYISGYKPIPLAGSAHACGTLVTGRDSRHAVVDANGKVFGMENLYVVDGSVLPRSSRVNPALTIYAWALRVASRLNFQGQNNEKSAAGSDTVRT